MADRRDALLGAAEIVLALERIALATTGRGPAFTTRFALEPDARGHIPSPMRLVASLRNTDQSALDPKKTDLATTAAEVARRRDMGVAVEYVSSYPALPFDPTLLQRLRDAADAAGLKRRGVPAPIGHGALNVGRVVLSATLFIPCRGSISHNPAESITPAWAAADLATLGPAVIETAGGLA